MGSGCSSQASAGTAGSRRREAEVVPLARGSTGDEAGGLAEGEGGASAGPPVPWAQRSGRQLDGRSSGRSARVRTGFDPASVASRGTAATATNVLAVPAEERIASPAAGLEAAAAAAYAARRKRGPVGAVEVRQEMRALYERKGLDYDADGVDEWIANTLAGMGHAPAAGRASVPASPGLSQDEFGLMYRCCSVFVTNRCAGASVPAAGAAHAVFLGGSCNPTTWRRDVAVPALDGAGVSYYNPQTDHWHPGLIEEEARAKETADDLLFVIDDSTRSIASMLEACEYISRGRRTLLVVRHLADGAKIDGEAVTGRQLLDLNRARLFLSDVASRHHHNAVVFDTVEEAVADLVRRHAPGAPPA